MLKSYLAFRVLKRGSQNLRKTSKGLIVSCGSKRTMGCQWGKRESISGKSHFHVNFFGGAALLRVGGREMKTVKLLSIGLVIVLLVSVPAVADAHWGFGGGLILGFGTGLITGFAFAPRPVYGAPPVYYAPPPPVAYPYYVPAPVIPDPAASVYSNNANVSSANPPPVGQSGCREWRLINRHWEKRWAPYYGGWQNVLVERWGWAGVPCNH